VALGSLAVVVAVLANGSGGGAAQPMAAAASAPADQPGAEPSVAAPQPSEPAAPAVPEAPEAGAPDAATPDAGSPGLEMPDLDLPDIAIPDLEPAEPDPSPGTEVDGDALRDLEDVAYSDQYCAYWEDNATGVFRTTAKKSTRAQRDYYTALRDLAPPEARGHLDFVIDYLTDMAAYQNGDPTRLRRLARDAGDFPDVLYQLQQTAMETCLD
jgi:hypothetical protein